MTEELNTKVKRGFLFVLVALVAGGLGLAAGRFTAPEKVTERIEFRSLAVEDITRGYTFARTVEVTRWRNVVTTTTDAGTVVTDWTIEREGTATTAAATEQLHHTESTERVQEKTVTLRPDWRIGAQVGASLHAPALVITGPLVLGVTVERRIIGGVSAGLWANTVGAAGASLSVEF